MKFYNLILNVFFILAVRAFLAVLTFFILSPLFLILYYLAT